MAGQGASADLAYRARQPSMADAPAFTGGLVGPNGAPLEGVPADSHTATKTAERHFLDQGKTAPRGYSGTTQEAYYGGGVGIDEQYADETAGGMTGTGAAPGETAARKSTSHEATAGGMATTGMHASQQPHEGVASDYDLQGAGRMGGAPDDVLYDQVSPRTLTTNGTKAARTSHTTNGNEVPGSNAAYGSRGNEAQAGNAPYGAYGNEAQGGNAAFGNEAYGGKETQASNAAYGNNEA